MRADEFTAAPEHVTRVYVVENEITYLAFPVPAAAMVILGAGYAVPVLEPLGWLAGCDVVYWRDIDTHGFAILNRLRRHLLHARSMLMDRATLLAHRDHWTTEPSPTTAVLDRLDPSESALYAELISDALLRRSAWNKNASASPRSKRQSPAADREPHQCAGSGPEPFKNIRSALASIASRIILACRLSPVG